MSDTDELKFHCASCPVAEDCRHAFGKYYEGKSRGGVGCNCPFPGYRRSAARETHFTTSKKGKSK